MATVPVAPPLCNYYTVNDSSPGSQVWDLAAGAFVALSDATFNSWLSQLANAPVGQPYYPFYLQILSAASSDGGTTTTFQVDNTSIMTTGARYNISATGLYDGNRAITVVDGTHVKISVAFAGNATGNLDGAAVVVTAAILNNLLRGSGLTLIPTTGGFYSVQTFNVVASPVMLANPLAVALIFMGSAGGVQNVILPLSNAPNSLPIGVPFLVSNQSSTILSLEYNSRAFVVQIYPNTAYWLMLDSNASSDGHVTILGALASDGHNFPLALGGLGEFVGVGDVSLSINSTTGLLYTVAPLTAPRTLTLPAANSLAGGSKIFVADLVGGVSATNTLSIARAGSDTINGGSGSIVLNHAYAWCCLITDAGTKWSSVDASDAWVGMSGDATVTRTGAVTVAKVNAVSYPAAPSTNTVPVVTGSNTVTYEKVPLAAGGTNADLSGTGGSHQVLKQGSSGAAVTVGQLASTDLSDLPIPISSGGTGDTGTAWTSYTPSIAAGAGAFTSASATGRYKTIGKTVFIQLNISITTNGTAAGWIECSLPPGITPAADVGYTLAGIDLFPHATCAFVRTINGSVGGPHARFFKYDGTYPGASGSGVLASGVFEST